MKAGIEAIKANPSVSWEYSPLSIGNINIRAWT